MKIPDEIIRDTVNRKLVCDIMKEVDEVSTKSTSRKQRAMIASAVLNCLLSKGLLDLEKLYNRIEVEADKIVKRMMEHK